VKTFSNFRQDRAQKKSPLEAERRLCVDKMEEQGVTMEDTKCGEELGVHIVHEETDLEVNSSIDWKTV